jgi:diacylglycerol kinase (ATP)
MRSYGRQRATSFGHAQRGLRHLLATEPNARVHATLAVVALAVACRLERWEWVALILATGSVWAAEALNTAVELLADEVTLERRERIGRAKDVAAAGVLATALAAAVVGLIVFAPHLRAFQAIVGA